MTKSYFFKNYYCLLILIPMVSIYTVVIKHKSKLEILNRTIEKSHRLYAVTVWLLKICIHWMWWLLLDQRYNVTSLSVGRDSLDYFVGEGTGTQPQDTCCHWSCCSCRSVTVYLFIFVIKRFTSCFYSLVIFFLYFCNKFVAIGAEISAFR
jgi:hypothetical protein